MYNAAVLLFTECIAIPIARVHLRRVFRHSVYAGRRAVQGADRGAHGLGHRVDGTPVDFPEFCLATCDK